MAVAVEANLTLEMANTMILPAGLRYQTELGNNVASLRAAGIDADTVTLNEVSSAITELRAGIASLRSEIAHDDFESAEKHAEHALRLRRPRDHDRRWSVATGHLPGNALHPLAD